MKRLMNFLRGMVTLKLTAPFPERLINLCAQEGIDFWAMEWLDEHTLRFTTRRHTIPQLLELAGRAGCEVVREGSRGLPDFLGRFRTRYAFLLGLTFALCAVTVLSRFVLDIRVTGNERVPTAVILSQLRQLGVRPGVYGPSLDREGLAQAALVQMEELSWMALNLHGTRLEVVVREAVKSPERLDESGYFHIVAEADGIVTRVEAEQGDAAVQAGDTVAAGDVVISGTVTMEPPLYSDLPTRSYQTHARGRVWARTWRTLTAAIPLETTVKEYTGGERSAWYLTVFGNRIKIFGSSSISGAMYDKITTVHQSALPGGTPLPLTLTRETARSYLPQTLEVDAQAARTLLEEQLLARLERLIGEDGRVEETRFSAREEGGLLKVTLEAQCTEEIGREEPGTVPEESGADMTAP